MLVPIILVLSEFLGRTSENIAARPSTRPKNSGQLEIRNDTRRATLDVALVVQA